MPQFKEGDIVNRIRKEHPGTTVRLEREAGDDDFFEFKNLGGDETVWIATVWEDSPVYPHHPEGKELIVRESNLRILDGRA